MTPVKPNCCKRTNLQPGLEKEWENQIFQHTIKSMNKDSKQCPVHACSRQQCDIYTCTLTKKFMPKLLPNGMQKMDIKLFDSFENKMIVDLFDEIKDIDKKRVQDILREIFSSDDESLTLVDLYKRAKLIMMEEVVEQLRRENGGYVVVDAKLNRKRKKSLFQYGTHGRSQQMREHDDRHTKHKPRKHRPISPPQFSPLREDSLIGENNNEPDQTQPTELGGGGMPLDPTDQQTQQLDEAITHTDDANNPTENKRNDNTEHSSGDQPENALENNQNDGDKNSENHTNSSVNPVSMEAAKENTSEINENQDSGISNALEDQIAPKSSEPKITVTEEMLVPPSSPDLDCPDPPSFSLFLQNGEASSIRDFIIHSYDDVLSQINDYLMAYSTNCPKPRDGAEKIVKRYIDILRWFCNAQAKIIPYGIISLFSCEGKTVQGTHWRNFLQTDAGKQLLLQKRVTMPPEASMTEEEFALAWKHICGLIREFSTNAQKFKKKIKEQKRKRRMAEKQASKQKKKRRLSTEKEATAK